ncbi:hypothetical protein [Streptomyces sp. NPDC047014]|uniref:hypothetical protein n=1 Tax=Streptomyces sp. NPDC047014 TaxID=3155736 RepID=UPI0033DB2D67
MIASPSHDNSCANHKTLTQPEGLTSNGSGTTEGMLAQLPVVNALNHCGGADLIIKQYGTFGDNNNNAVPTP